MSHRFTQAEINKVHETHEAGTQLYDTEVSGLRVVVGKRSSSYKFVGRINDQTNRYVSIVLGRIDDISLKSAREQSVALKQKLRQGEDPRKPRTSAPSLEDACGRYLTTRGSELSDTTVKWYQQKLDGPLSAIKKIPVDKIDRETVRTLHEKITSKSGAYAANGAMRVLKLVLNDAARTHDLPPNPVSLAVRMNKEEAHDWAIGPDEMPVFWQKLDNIEDRIRRACWLLMLTTGLRSSNARSAKWEHMDEDSVLFVPKAKSGRSFKLPIPRLVTQELEEVRELTKPLESEFIFASPFSKVGHIQELRRTKSFPYAPHQMRHTYRTHALEAGIDFQSVTMLMDHANSHVSFNYVTRAHLMGHLRECQETICNRLLGFRGHSARLDPV